MDLRALLSGFLVLYMVITVTSLLGPDASGLHLDDAEDPADMDSPLVVRVRRQAGAQLMKLKLRCPDTDAGAGLLTLVHDGDAIATAECVNGNKSFTRRDIATLELKLQLNGTHDPTACRLHTSAGMAKTYSVVAAFAAGTNVSAMFFSENEENAICNYDDIGHSFGNLTRILRPVVRPHDKPIYRGGAIQYQITMDVINVLGESQNQKGISMSRLIRLRALVHTPHKAIYPLSCIAMNSARAKYDIIKGSCGDGLVFGQNDGFTSYGNVTYSPYFKVFRLAGGVDLQFKCMFATCDIADCNNKNSCPYAKQKTTQPPLVVP